MPYLADGSLLEFKKTDQIVIEGFLMAASGIKGEMDNVYNIKPEERVALLKYVLLMTLNLKLSEEAVASNSPRFFQEKISKAKQLSVLPTISSLSDVDAHTSVLNEAWREATPISVPFEDENLKLLVQAISRLKNEEQDLTVATVSTMRTN